MADRTRIRHDIAIQAGEDVAAAITRNMALVETPEGMMKIAVAAASLAFATASGTCAAVLEHSAWGGRDRRGYTRIVANAGRYNRAEALSIAGARDGGWHVRKGNPDEIAIPEQDAIDQYAHITRAQREDGTISEAEIPY